MPVTGPASPVASMGLGGNARAREGFEAELLCQRDALLRLAIRLTGEPADAEDLVSDTVLRALNRWHQYRPGTNLRAWLFTILYRLFVSQRRRPHGREVPLIEGEDDAAPYRPVGMDPEQCLYKSLLDEEIARCVQNLPAPYRRAVVLRDIDDLSYTQIAQVMGIATGTVKSRVFRARRMLRTKLGGHAADMGYVRGQAAA
jgi:RNA polymerase sigma-70 factor (ECF subfamily)